MKKLSILIVAIALLSLAGIAQAGEIWGAIDIGIKGTDIVLSDDPILAFNDAFVLNNLFANNNGSGDFITVAGKTALLPIVNNINAVTPAGFAFGDGSFGTWVASSGYHTHSPDGKFLNISMLGIFTPGTYFPGKTWNNAELNLSFTQTVSGTSIANSMSGTMAMKGVPEASTLVGFGSALAMAGPGLVGWLRRRRA